MTTTQNTGFPVRLISYGNDHVNMVGLSPISGRVEDQSPAMRERWALRFGEVNGPHGAQYLATVTEMPPAPCALADSYGIHAAPVALPRVQTAEMPIVRVETTEFEMPFNVKPMMHVVTEADARKANRGFAQAMREDDGGLSLDALRDLFGETHEDAVEADDILIDSVDDDPCHFCGEIEGYHHKTCPFGGLL